MKTELINPNYYQFEDLRYELSKTLGKPMSRRTLWHWLEKIGIGKDSCGFYHRSDLDLLVTWATTRDTFKTFDNFNNWRKEHYASNRRTAQPTDQTDPRPAQTAAA